MKKVCIYGLFLFVLIGCVSETLERPVCLDKSEVFFVPGGRIQFQATGKKWHASLVSFVQPILMTIHYNNTGFTVSMDSKHGVVEGNTTLCLSAENQFFYYPVNLKNKDKSIVVKKDYRSPKTINPDSSLLQQQIIHVIDAYRNLVYIPEKQTYFFESETMLMPRAATYHAMKNDGLTAYYVQPGSCTNIPVIARYNDKMKCYEVSAGKLKDRYNNTVADGTLVSFIYSDLKSTYHMESTLVNGYSSVTIPALKDEGYKLRIFVNNSVSAEIKLIP